MPKLNENKKILAVGAGGLVLCLAAGGGVWWSKGLVEEREVSIAAAKQSIEDANRKIEQIQGLEKDVIILRENVETYTKILPDQSEVTDLIRTTNRFAFQAGVVVEDLLKAQPGKRGKYSSYSYRLEFDATIWQFMKFVNQFENYDRFIRVVSFQVRSASKEQVAQALATGTDARHKFSLTVETFVYEGKNSGKNVDISAYAAKREKYAAEIAAGANKVGLSRFDYVEERGRRDIFVDPRPTIGGSIQSDNPRVWQQKTIADFVLRIAEAREIHTLWKQDGIDYLTKEGYTRRLRDLLTALEQDVTVTTPKLTNQQLVKDWNSDVVHPMREMWHDLRGGLENIDSPNSLTEERLTGILADMRSAIQRGEYETAIRLHDENQDRLNFQPTDPRFATALQIQKTKEAVQTIVEFSEIPMHVEGVVVFDEGRSGLLVNGKVYEEGEYLDDNLLLKAVGREQADFVFKGFVVRKKW